MKTQLTSSESYWYEYITDGGLINKNEAKEIMETNGVEMGQIAILYGANVCIIKYQVGHKRNII